MTFVTAVVSVAAFGIALWLSGAMRVSTGVFATAQNAAAIMRDDALDDLAREKAIQRASLQLMAQFGSIVLRAGLSLVASFIPIWLADATGLASTGAVVAFLSRWDVIVATTSVMIVGYMIRMRLWPSN